MSTQSDIVLDDFEIELRGKVRITERRDDISHLVFDPDQSSMVIGGDHGHGQLALNDGSGFDPVVLSRKSNELI